MTHKQDKKSHTFTNFLGELSCIFGDVFFMYRNFFHWNISKILITIWSFVLASIIALPVLFLAIVIGFIDPINWNIFIESELLGTDPTLEMIANISTHPFWLGGVVFFIVLSAFLFFSSLSYGLFLMLRISLKYTQRKKLALRKNLYFSKKHMYSFYILLGKTMFVVISPLFIWTLLAII